MHGADLAGNQEDPEPGMLKQFLIALIRFYQMALSPFFPQNCRFYPTCSAYAIEAIQTYGAMRGVIKSSVRVMKCNPLHPGGYDPV